MLYFLHFKVTGKVARLDYMRYKIENKIFTKIIINFYLEDVANATNKASKKYNKLEKFYFYKAKNKNINLMNFLKVKINPRNTLKYFHF